MMKLPDNPTEDQLKSVALLTIRATFEDTAENLRDLTPMEDGGWQAVYSVGGADFNIEYTEADGFTKWPAGVDAK